MKTIPLTIANLKGFVRDWQSVLLLIGVPLIIIGLIFASFSPQGIKLPIGTVDRTQDFNYQRFRQSTSSFARLIQYRNLKNCAGEIRDYDVYACIVITKQKDSEQYEIQVFYDNTRSIIGRRITQNVKQVADLMQLDYSKQRASTVINEVRQLTQDIRELQTQVNEAQRDIDQRIIEINRQIRELRQTRRNIRRQIDQMDAQVQDVEQDIEQLEQMRKNYYQDTKQRINRIQLLLSNMENMSSQNEYYASQMQTELQEAENDLETYNNEVKQEIDDVNQLIADYEQFSAQTEQYLAEINQTIRDLERTRSELRAYRRDLEQLEQQLASMEQRYSRIASMSPSEVAGFISVTNRPAYLPQEINTQQQGTSMIVGGNLVMLQTMYSTLLLLVALFVSLLVSKFITLNEINALAKKRLKMIDDTFFPEYLSVYISSMIIIAVPLLCVLLLGQYLFQLPILSNLPQVVVLLFLLCSSIVNLGIGTAYLIQKKSITLLIGSFVLVFLIFFSGFVLPIELMAELSGNAAWVLPGSVAKRAFDIAVLYRQPFGDIADHLLLLGGWTVLSSLTALGIKRQQDV